MTDHDATPEEWLRIARVNVMRSGDVVVVRLTGISPAVTFFGSLAVMLMIFVFLYPFVGMIWSVRSVPLPVAAAEVAVAVFVAALLAYRRHLKIASGREDLVIDKQGRSLSLPHTFGRKEDTFVSFDRILEITPGEELLRKDDILDAHTFGPKTYKKRTASPADPLPDTSHRSEMRFAILVCWRDPEDQEIVSPIVTWSTRARVWALSFWLRDELGLPLDGRS